MPVVSMSWIASALTMNSRTGIPRRG
jgi:hypothetical protein